MNRHSYERTIASRCAHRVRIAIKQHTNSLGAKMTIILSIFLISAFLIVVTHRPRNRRAYYYHRINVLNRTHA